MRIKDDVAIALKHGKPIVALETTIISHGLPYPTNLETAFELEEIIRSLGATPATLGIVDGEIVIGLSKDEIRSFATRKDIIKVSKRDLPIVMAKKLWGAITVSATLILAKMAGIKYFATGGIGGVHRGASNSFDVSRDLYEIASSPVVTVCSGAKAILDIPKTLEVLETLGVSILSYKSRCFPAFYSRSTPYPVDYDCQTIDDLLRIIQDNRKLDKNGILVVNPCPEEDEIPFERIESLIEEAIQMAERKGVHGKDMTPFLLSSLCEISDGQTLKANVSLVKNNAHLAAQLAVHDIS